LDGLSIVESFLPPERLNGVSLPGFCAPRLRVIHYAACVVEYHLGHRTGSNGVQVRPLWLGLPVRAKLAHAVAIFLASACAFGVLPVPCMQRLVLSKQKASSAVCQAPRHRASAIAR